MHADTAVGGLFLSASQELTQPMANLTKSRIWKKHYRLNFYSTRLKKNPTSLHHKQSAATSLLFFALFIVGDTEDSLAESLGTIWWVKLLVMMMTLRKGFGEPTQGFSQV